jgi:hypothetical protein
VIENLHQFHDLAPVRLHDRSLRRRHVMRHVTVGSIGRHGCHMRGHALTGRPVSCDP